LYFNRVSSCVFCCLIRQLFFQLTEILPHGGPGELAQSALKRALAFFIIHHLDEYHMFKKTLAMLGAIACLAAPCLPVVSAQTFLIGDVDQDNSISFKDIQPLIGVLYSGQYQDEADINGDSFVNFLDIQPFIDLVTSQSVPVSTPSDLERIRTSPNNNFHLTNDIDLAAVADFQPIGTNGDPFEAIFEGNGHNISSLTINARPQRELDASDPFFAEDFIGLFAFTDGATIRNVNLTGVSIYGELMVGSLVGQCRQSTVTGCTASGIVGGLRQVGGLIGFMGDSDVANCSTNVNVEYCEVVNVIPGFGEVFYDSFWFGGLVGHVHPYRFPGRAPTNTGDGSSLSSCFTLGDVYGSFIAGGVAGNFHGATGDNCFAIGNVETEFSVAGGLIGWVQTEPGLSVDSAIPTTFLNSGAYGDVKCNAFGTPPIVGFAPKRPGDVFDILQGAGAGGFVGYCEGGLGSPEGVPSPLSEFVNCSAEGDVEVLDTNNSVFIAAGGFVGWTEVFSLISDCQSTGNVMSLTGSSVGGFVGWAEGVIENSVSEGDVTGPRRIGGFAGQVASTPFGTGDEIGPFSGKFQGCVSFGETLSNFNTPLGGEEVLAVGGFVGYSFGGVEFANCHSHGGTTATSQFSGFVGGFIGQASNDTITECSSSGEVVAKFGNVGGFIGRQRLKDGLNVADSFSTSNVVYTGIGTPTGVGGFIGSAPLEVSIDRCYSAGHIDAPNGPFVRGFVGFPSFRMSVADCYWDTTAVGQITGSQPSGVNGRTTSQMQQQATFAGWDFTNIWDVVENASYPFFK